ncbi:MAG: response regulator [Lachnospiraceae bacterium]|nr:response regulator [Lachnospiraceae bacterium]
MAAGMDKENKAKVDERDLKIERLQKELKFAKNQMVAALSMYDEARHEADLAVKAKGEFMSKLSHEFRTPMNALMGYSDLLIKREGDEATKRYASGVKSATNRLLNLFNDLIEVSRIESGITFSECEEYDSGVLIDTIMDSISNEVSEKGLLMKLNFDEHLPSKMYGDFFHLRQIICNLLDNAVKYTDKGYISLDISGQWGDKRPENGRRMIQLAFKVKDTGAGIRKKDIDKLFTVFEQFNSKNPYANQGVGVGLTVAKYYSNKMHGDISFESKYGEGSEFTCTVIQEAVDETPLGETYTYDGHSRRQIVFTAETARILVVDDSQVNLNVAKGLLEDFGIKADMADGGMEAIRKVGRKNYDLIFMDHMMPDIDGVETMKRIRDKGNWCETVPIIALTANVTDEARHLFKMEGMQDFLAKPIEIGLLRDILLKWLPKEKIVFNDVTEGYISDEEVRTDAENTIFTKERFAKEDIDLELGLSYFGGNVSAYKSTLNDIISDSLRQLVHMEEYYMQMDLKNYAIQAHSIKSVSATIGATTFSELAKEHELRAKAEDKAFIKENGASFLIKYNDFLMSISTLLKEEASYLASRKDNVQSGESTHTSDKEMMDESQIKEIIKKSIAALEDFEADDAAKLLQTIQSERVKVDLVEQIYVIQEKIDDFEYDEAAEMLKKLL